MFLVPRSRRWSHFRPLLLLYDSWREKRQPGPVGGSTRRPPILPIALPLYRRSRIGPRRLRGRARRPRRVRACRGSATTFDLPESPGEGKPSPSTGSFAPPREGGPLGDGPTACCSPTRSKRRARKARALEALPTVSKALSAASMLPDNQPAKIERIHAMAPLLDELPTALAPVQRLEPRDPHRDVLRAGSGRSSTTSRRRTMRILGRDLLAIRGSITSLPRPNRTTRWRSGHLGAYETFLLDDFADTLGVLRESRRVTPLGIEEPTTDFSRPVRGPDTVAT